MRFYAHLGVLLVVAIGLFSGCSLALGQDFQNGGSQCPVGGACDCEEDADCSSPDVCTGDDPDIHFDR